MGWGTAGRNTAKFLLPVPEMGRNKEGIFKSLWHYVFFCFPKVCWAHLTEEEKNVEKGRWRVWGVQLQGTTGVWYLGKNVNQSWPDSCVGFQQSKLFVLLAEDSELPLIMVQSIKFGRLVSLTAFGSKLWQQYFGNLNVYVLRIALISEVFLLQRTPPNARGWAFHFTLLLFIYLPILVFCTILCNFPCTNVRLLFLGFTWNPF